MTPSSPGESSDFGGVDPWDVGGLRNGNASHEGPRLPLTMADAYQSFQELESKEREGEDWVREYINRGSRILVMAPHGGWIEPFTAELARAVAGNDLSFYTFQGLKKRGNEKLHLTSHLFDEPLAQRAASSALWVLAIHGERSPDRSFVMVGGLWGTFRKRLAEAFTDAGISVEGPRQGLGGANPRNICNRGQSGAGGQLEISEGLRRALRKDQEGLRRFVELVRGVLFQVEHEENLPALVNREVRNKLKTGKKNPGR